MNELYILTAWALLQLLSLSLVTGVVAAVFFVNKEVALGWMCVVISILSALYFLPNIVAVLISFDFLYNAQKTFVVQ